MKSSLIAILVALLPLANADEASADELVHRFYAEGWAYVRGEARGKVTYDFKRDPDGNWTLYIKNDPIESDRHSAGVPLGKISQTIQLGLNSIRNRGGSTH